MSTIAELQNRAYAQSADKGFHDDHINVGQPGALAQDAMKIALVHSELSEALEELRNGSPLDRNYYTLPGVPGSYASAAQARSTHHGPNVTPKPEGLPSEMADVVIRVMDYCESRGINLESAIIEKLDYNATRAHKHGGKSF